MSKRTNTILNLSKTNINRENLTEYRFDMEKGILKAKEKLLKYHEIMGRKINAKFENDQWYFENPGYERAVTFDFSNIKEPRVFINILKCWTAQLLDEKALFTAHRKLQILLTAIYISNGFEEQNKLIEVLEESSFYRLKDGDYEAVETGTRAVLGTISAIVEFLNFLDRDQYASLIQSLLAVYSKNKGKANNRTIPSFKDTLKFKLYLDNWFEDAINNEDKTELIRYLPLVIFWRLTMIIPMRPLEFCKIRRDCINREKDRYTISFPRFKSHRKGIHRIKIFYDTLPITLEICNLIQLYVDLTNEFGESRYLIHRVGYNKTFLERPAISMKNDFNTDNLTYLLCEFYDRIIFEKHKVNLLAVKGSYFRNRTSYISNTARDSIDSIIFPGDLRHLAIINMMMQGYDKVEIQRLAGHITDETQYNYFSHMENWMDVEISRLQNELKKQTVSDLFGEVTYLKHHKIIEFLDQKNKANFIAGEHVDRTMIKLRLGYCMDESMPCPTFNWKHSGCYFCKNWFISSEELENEKRAITADMNNVYDELKMKINFLKSLYEKHSNYPNSRLDEYKSELSSTAKELDLGIRHIAKLRTLLEVE